MNQKTLDALASSIYVSRLALAGQAVSDDDQRLRASGLYEDWAPGKWSVGDICNTRTEDGQLEQTWECFQDFDNAVYPDIVPGNPAWFTFMRPLHGKTPETARPFVPVMGSHDIYRAGEYAIWEGEIRLCKQDTNFSPADYPGAWEVA